MTKRQKILLTVFRFAAAIILLQTLAFKFTAHPDSVHIFSTLGLEPYGRIGTGILELIAGGLLIYSRLSFLGALLAIGLMSGAIFSHLVVLGIEVNNDGGSLFTLAIVTFVCSAGVLYLQRAQLLRIFSRLFPKSIAAK
ncbi:MAG: DoxX family protein [Phaeodactylibacter sp.]|nr:DoxX family protein [Phaeodactylibacter sp.]